MGREEDFCVSTSWFMETEVENEIAYSIVLKNVWLVHKTRLWILRKKGFQSPRGGSLKCRVPLSLSWFARLRLSYLVQNLVYVQCDLSTSFTQGWCVKKIICILLITEVHLAQRGTAHANWVFFQDRLRFLQPVLRWYCHDAVCSVTLQNSKIWTADISFDFSVNIPADF